MANTRGKLITGGLSAAVLAAAALLGISPEAVQITKESEGRVHTVYVDPVGIRTVCDGHTQTGLVAGKVYTHAECDAFLIKDLQAAYDVVHRCVPGAKAPEHVGALVDFALNVGPGGKGRKDGLCELKSGKVPTIRRLFNTGQYEQACKEFPKWNAQKLRGIDIRRQKEMVLCLSAKETK